MNSMPLVSIVLPLSSGGERDTAAVRACTVQSLDQIEIILVVDETADADALGRVADADSRVRVIRGAGAPLGAEPLRTAAITATAPRVLLLSAGDEIDRDAARTLHRVAADGDADLVRFAAHAGEQPAASRGEQRQRTLRGDDILRRLFPDRASAEHRSWRYLFRTDLLRGVLETLPAGSVEGLANHLPVIFLASASAQTHITTAAPLYRPRESDIAHPGSRAEFDRILDEIDAVSRIADPVRARARVVPNPEPLIDGYEALRLSTIARGIETALALPGDTTQHAMGLLQSAADPIDTIAAAARFSSRALRYLSQSGDRIELGQGVARRLLLTTNVLTTGGVSGVLRAQARMLLDAGYEVTIATHRAGTDLAAVPEGATLVQISGSPWDRVAQWAELCRERQIDVVIDHRILYSRDWPAYALAARQSGAATIGWIHNFAGRPTYNGNDLHTLMRDNMGALAQLIVLSPLDVAFWKLRGVEHVAYLPNPPSPLLLDSIGKIAPKAAPADRPVELVWWGRLEEHTKKVSELVAVAAELKRLGVEFRMRIIGPDWADMTATRLATMVSARALDGFVEVTGPRHGADLLAAIDSADIFVNTSIIEGYPLTLSEAQSHALPVAMYDLPWLALTQDNPGVVSVPQGDAAALALAISEIVADSERYEAMSAASTVAAARATSYDFAHLYERLVTGALPDDFSPSPTLDDGRKLLTLLIQFAEKSSSPDATVVREARRAARRRAAPRSLGQKIEAKLTGTGHRVLGLAPSLRPALRRIKNQLVGR